MDLGEDAVMLRIYTGESKRWQHQALYEALIFKAREQGLAGATVLRGPMGYGEGSHMHTAKILQLSADLPILIEIIDSEEKIEAFLPVLHEMMDHGRATLEKVKLIQFGTKTVF